MVPECFDRYKFDYIGRVLIGIAQAHQILNYLFPAGEKIAGYSEAENGVVSGLAVIRPQPDQPANYRQNENVACAKMRRAAEPVLNAPPAREVERSKYGVPSTPTGVP
jgi:hypothetical protein